LWWLLGAVVAFYFGARETFYFRNRPAPGVPLPLADPGLQSSVEPDEPAMREPNAALRDWQAGDR
jgi:hypothetical protein